MNNKRFSVFAPLARLCVALLLVVGLVFSQAHSALAARTGGGYGGGSFRRPAPMRTVPSRPAPSYGGGYPVPVPYGGGFGGGFGFPFMLPFFFGGGGTIVSILVFIAIANFLVSAFRRAATNESGGIASEQDLTNPPVSVNTLQLGLLSEARSLQSDLDRIALKADTGSSAGLTDALQETTLALLRNPEYWVYANAEGQQTRLLSAEAEFSRRTLSERSKFQEETLSNYSDNLRQKSATATLEPADEGALLTQAPGEYIVVTLIVASQGKLDLPKTQSTQDVKQALSSLGGIGDEDLLAMRVLWTPQADGDTLTSEDLLEAYPSLRRL
jgi:uncharacterized membrane protein